MYYPENICGRKYVLGVKDVLQIYCLDVSFAFSPYLEKFINYLFFILLKFYHLSYLRAF